MNITLYARTTTLVALLGFLGGVAHAETALQQSPKPGASAEMDVYKTPQCGCCADWVTHMQAAGFKMQVNDSAAPEAIKSRFGIHPQLQSCHTAHDPGTNYVFEGHIPAPVIQRFIEEQPEGARGLAVPGMPIGSPGMEMGDRRDSYNVWMIMEDGSSQIYTRIKGDDH